MDITTEYTTGESLSFCLALARTYATLSRKFDGRLGSLHGLSFADFTMLLQLRRAPAGRLRRVDLAEALGLTASAVTRALIPLEKIGLVSREPDPHDARVGYAMLTKAGQRVLDEAVESADQLSRDTISRATVPELPTLLKALGRLA
jgi:DNA-binding MarR family transcriptional regulator